MARRFQIGRLFKRGNIWAARWYEDVLLEDGSRGRERRYRSFGAIPKREAQMAFAAILDPINRGKQRPQSVMTLGDFVRQQWVPAAMLLLDPITLKVKREAIATAATGRPGTAAAHGSKLLNHILPTFEKKPLREITRYEVARFLSEKRQQRHSAAHVRAIRATFSKVMQAAVEWEMIEANPVRGCRVEGGEPKRPRVALTPEQAAKLLAALPEPCRSVVLLSVLTGCRIGEVLALLWRRIDFEAGTVNIQASYSERWGIGLPKTKRSQRIIPITDPLRKVLLAHRDRSKSTGEGDYVFASDTGRPLNVKNLRARALDPTRKELGLPVLGFHDLRHTAASWLGNAGAQPKDVQDVLGHSTPEMAIHYTHTTPEHIRTAMERASKGVWALLGTVSTGGSGAVN